MTLHSDHHDSLSHRHEPCSLACAAFLRFCSRTRFWSLTCSACTHAVVFDCLNFSQKYFFSPVHCILELNIEFYSQVLFLMGFFLRALSLTLKRPSKQVLKNILKVHMLCAASPSSTSEPIRRVKILENILFWESSLIFISGSGLIVVSPLGIIRQYFICASIKFLILVDFWKLVFGISRCTFIRMVLLGHFVVGFLNLVLCGVFTDPKDFFSYLNFYHIGLSFWMRN